MKKVGFPRRRGLLGPWDPFEEIRRTQDRLNELFDEISPGTELSTDNVMAPLIDVEENENNVVVTADIPGINKEDIDISINDDMLQITGKCQTESEEKNENYIHRERAYSMFSRAVKLPASVQEDGATAKLENGVLKVALPKSQIEDKEKKILIE